MGILTGALLVAIIGKCKSLWNKKNITHFKNIENLHHAKKIAIIGCAGSGKTYLTFKLQEKLNLPVHHLDQYHWLPNWQRVDEQTFTKVHHDLCKQDRWIIEGIYFRHVQERVQAADAIIFLDLPRTTCLKNVIKRSVYNNGKVIDGNPEGCVQNIFSFKFLEFLGWIWNFNTKHRPAAIETLKEFENTKQIYIIKSKSQMNQFLEKI